MLENKNRPTTVSVSAFLDACADEWRRADARALVKLMEKVTGKKAGGWPILSQLHRERVGWCSL